MELGKYHTTVNMFFFFYPPKIVLHFLLWKRLYTKPKFLVLMASRSFCLRICLEE